MKVVSMDAYQSTKLKKYIEGTESSFKQKFNNSSWQLKELQLAVKREDHNIWSLSEFYRKNRNLS